MGKDDNMPLTGVAGGNLPSQIWSQIMQRIHLKVPEKLPILSTKDFKKARPDSLIEKNGDLFRESYETEEVNIFLRFLKYLNGNNH